MPESAVNHLLDFSRPKDFRTYLALTSDVAMFPNST
jgi:hypothetical protein